jgi:choline-glycine betaine transporter
VNHSEQERSDLEHELQLLLARIPWGRVLLIVALVVSFQALNRHFQSGAHLVDITLQIGNVMEITFDCRDEAIDCIL